MCKFAFQYQENIGMREVKSYMRDYKPFRWGSSSGLSDGDEYVLMSYATVIARVNVDTGEVTYFDNNRYSSTTSRFQNMIREVFLND